jgi:hypothetical protein
MGVATILTIEARAHGRLPEEMMMIGMSSPKRGLPKASTETTTMATKAATTMVVATTAVTMMDIMATTTPSDYIRCVVELAINPSRISTRRPMNVSKPWKR